MSRLYDTVEPSVIDDEMLQQAVEEQGPKGEAGRVARLEGVEFVDVQELRLDFRNILIVENLHWFKNLVKLQMDNNIIEKIQGLETLVSLIWLDLSFNNIELIEGLDRLVLLEDLSLYNNRIQRLENMDNLRRLQVLSVGNNDLKNLDNLVYLRRFKSLGTLNLSGNPLCELENCKEFIAAHLPQLEFLNYRLIDPALKTEAYGKYETTIQELENDESQAERKAKEDDAVAKERELHKNAYVENLNGADLFDSMYLEDVEGRKLNYMPGVGELLQEYRNRTITLCKEIFQFGLKKHEEREGDVAEFQKGFDEAKNENKKSGQALIDEFMDYKKKLWKDLLDITDQKRLENIINQYNVKGSELWDGLMGLEMQLVDQLEDALREFDRNLSDLVSFFIENVQGFMTQIRDLENAHHEKLLEIAVHTLDSNSRNDLDEDIPEDLRELLVDKDTVTNAVTSSHDIHLLKIDNREDDIITKINQWMSNLSEELHAREETKRNRARVIEINHLIDYLRDEMDNLDLLNADRFD